MFDGLSGKEFNSAGVSFQILLMQKIVINIVVLSR